MSDIEDSAVITDGFPSDRLIGGQQEIHAIIMGAVGIQYESIVEQLVGCRGHALWFRYEGAWIWDPYGSLIRSVLLTVHRHQTIRKVYVVAHGTPEKRCPPGFHDKGLRENLTPAVERTVQYLLQYVYHVDSNRWFDTEFDSEESVAQSVRLISDHPLMPSRVAVQGLLLNTSGPQGSCVEVSVY